MLDIRIGTFIFTKRSDNYAHSAPNFNPLKMDSSKRSSKMVDKAQRIALTFRSILCTCFEIGVKKQVVVLREGP